MMTTDRSRRKFITTGALALSGLTGRDVAIAVQMGNQAAETEKTQYWKNEYSG